MAQRPGRPEAWRSIDSSRRSGSAHRRRSPRFLRKTLAAQRVEVTVQRDGQTIAKSVILGSVPTQHVADFFDGGKSPRRDGFPSVFCHDAILLPDECGGPLFDLDGHLVGLNIARVSRTHCYAVPLATLAAFWERSQSQP